MSVVGRSEGSPGPQSAAPAPGKPLLAIIQKLDTPDTNRGLEI